MNNMNNTQYKDSQGYLDTTEREVNAGSTPLLHPTTTGLESHQSDHRPPDYEPENGQNRINFMNMDEAHVPPLEADRKFDFTGHVDIAFEKIFPETETTQVEALSVCMKALFTWTHRLIYTFLTLIIATFLVLIWGIVFAIMNFIVVWILQPSIRLIFMFMRMSGELVRIVTITAVLPYFQAVGAVFSNYRGNFNVNVAAQEPLTPADLPLPHTV